MLAFFIAILWFPTQIPINPCMGFGQCMEFKGGLGLRGLNCEMRGGESEIIFALYSGLVSEMFGTA